MTNWLGLATLVAILFGTHNLFVKRAAGRLPDVWGALVLEGTATIVIVGWLLLMATAGRAPILPRDPGAVVLAASGGLFIGIASVLYFWVFRLGAPLSVAVPTVLIGWVVVGAGLGTTFEDEPFGWRQAGGIGCGLIAIWLLR